MDNKHSFNILEKFYTWCEGKNLLSDTGIENLETFGINSKMYKEDFTDLGKILVANYFTKWNESISIETLTQESTDEFWDHRLNEMNLVYKRKVINESSFNFDTTLSNNDLDIQAYFESIDYNLPSNTKQLVLNTEYHNHYLMINEAVAYDENGLKIKCEPLQILSYNPKAFCVPVRESSELKEVTKQIIRGLKYLKEEWNAKDRYSNKILVEGRFPELNLAIVLNEGLFSKPQTISKSEYSSLKNKCTKTIETMFDDLAKNAYDRYTKKMPEYKEKALKTFNSQYEKGLNKSKTSFFVDIKLPLTFNNGRPYIQTLREIINKNSNNLPSCCKFDAKMFSDGTYYVRIVSDKLLIQ